MQKIHDRVYFVEAVNKARPPYCYCLFIDDDVKAVIDTSCGLQAATDLAAKGVEVVLNSHFHEDHVMFNYLFEKAEVWLHEADVDGLLSVEGFAEHLGYITEEDRALAREILEWIPFNPSPVSRTIDNGQILDFGRTKLQVVHLPGHSPGHCGFYQENTGMLFTADIDLTKFGPWYGFGSCNIDDFIASIKKCIEINPRQIITSHGGIFESDTKKLLEDYLRILYNKEENIYNSLKTPQTLEQLASQWLFSTKQPPYQYEYAFFFERTAINKHLTRLIRDGRIKQEGNIFYSF